MIAKSNRTLLKKPMRRFLVSLASTLLLLLVVFTLRVHATPGITISLGAGEESGAAFGPIEMLFLFALLALAPSILIMMTSFTRIVIVLSFLRNALGTQQSPPNQILVGLALFLSLFIMMPTIMEINNDAFKPYQAGALTQDEAVGIAVTKLKGFMLPQIDQNSLSLFLSIADDEEQTQLAAGSQEDMLKMGLQIIVPAFITSELKQAFQMGFLLFIPFLIIDIVVSSTLMSMGMVMLPPSMIALPFKIMMFVLVDGWGLLLGTLAQSFK